MCRKHGIYILSDEIFNGLGRSGTTHLPYVTEIYERGLSLNVMSKAYGMPGLRIGWIASADKDVLQKMERVKHYLSICNSAPGERLAKIALGNRAQILARNCKIIDDNLEKLNPFFERHADLFDWRVSEATCLAFPRYLGADGVEHFTQQLLEEAGVLLLPGSIYSSELSPTPLDRFRIGFGRSAIDEGIAAMDSHLQRIHV